MKLFERRARALLLTENGQLFYRAAQDALQKLHDSARRLRGTATLNTVVVATTPGFATLWLIPHLAGFTRNHPHVDVRISATNEMIDDLERAGVDLAVRYVPEGSGPADGYCSARRCFRCAARSLRAIRANPLVTPDDLHHHVLLYLEHAARCLARLGAVVSCARPPRLRACGQAALQPLRPAHPSRARRSRRGTRSPSVLRRLLRERKLVAPFKKKVASSRAYYVVESPAAKSKPQVREFADWLVEETHAETLAAPAGETA